MTLSCATASNNPNVLIAKRSSPKLAVGKLRAGCPRVLLEGSVSAKNPTQRRGSTAYTVASRGMMTNRPLLRGALRGLPPISPRFGLHLARHLARSPVAPRTAPRARARGPRGRSADTLCAAFAPGPRMWRTSATTTPVIPGVLHREMQQSAPWRVEPRATVLGDKGTSTTRSAGQSSSGQRRAA